MTTFQPRQSLGGDQEEKEEDSPSFGSCRPLSRVADSGPKTKVNFPLISTCPSLMIYPHMCGLIPEPESRPGLSPVNPSSTPGALTSRGRPNKGPAEVYLFPRTCGLITEPDSRPGLSPVNSSCTTGALTSRGRPTKGPADVYPLPKLRVQPHQVGLAEVLPERV